MKSIFFFTTLYITSLTAVAQQELPAGWRAHLVRQDGNEVVFNMETKKEEGQIVFYIINAAERIRISPVNFSGDSIFFDMPVFESYFRVKKSADGNLHGTWTKGTAGDYQYWKFYAQPNQLYRFPLNTVPVKYNISGRWDVTITRSNGTLRKAVAEFVQKEDKLTGTLLTPSGDARYLDGIVKDDSLRLTTFDGAHAYIFTAKIDDNKNISGGAFYAGFSGKETWIAEKNADIKIPDQNDPTSLKTGETRLNFAFNDLDGKSVSINDEKFKNKVVIIQIMGSWCPNCMDETKFLSEYYNKHKTRGVEVIGLAYEYSTDLDRSKKSLRKFQRLFHVQYPMLITGATASDDLKTEKTLPQLTPIRSFPTTIFIDRKGNVIKIKGDFYGPGTGIHYEEFKKNFYAMVDKLLEEK